MKKFILFIGIVIILASSFLWFLHRPRDYELSYSLENADITEKYDKKTYYYFFTIKANERVFHYSIPLSYHFYRRKINRVIVENNEDIVCVTPIIENENLETMCHDGKQFMDSYLAKMKDQETANKVNSYQTITIYNQDYNYLIWNNRGFTDIKNNQDYSFLKNEVYTNNLIYQWDDYLLVPNYDETRSFKKFYLLEYSKGKQEEWEIPYEISFDSYFMGDVDGKIYLFDTKERCQYAIDIKNRKIEISSDKEGGVIYQKEWSHKPLNELTYHPETFTYERQYNFEVKGNTLYMHYYKNKDIIKLSNKKIDHIVYTTDKIIYYLVGEKLYSYEIGKGEQLLLTNFEWNFSYLNKIFVFD